MTDVVMVESWGLGDLMSPICSLKLCGSCGVRGRTLGLVFPESHCLAEGACVCLQPGAWCQVVAHSYCYFAASKRNETEQPANWYLEESALSLSVSVGVVGEVVSV